MSDPQVILVKLIDHTKEILELIEFHKSELLSKKCAIDFKKAIYGFYDELANSKEELVKYFTYSISSHGEQLNKAGLKGDQLNFKYNSFERSFKQFKKERKLEDLEDALDKSATMLGSAAGIIPLFGSFAQEFIDFLNKEIKKRVFPWRKNKYNSISR